MQLEIIEWYDHWGRTEGGWMALEELGEPKPCIMRSVGWVIKETKDCILLSPDLDDGDHDGFIKSNHEQCILKCAVLKRTRLSLPKQVKSRKKLKQ